MLSSLSSSRIRAVVSLAGVALSSVGFFLPMFTESNPGVPGSAHPVYEWQVVLRLASSSVLAGSFAVLSLLGVLISFMVIFGSALRFQTTFTPLTCILLAIGSMILGLEWVFFDFFVGMVVIDLYTWLPLIVLLGVVAPLMTKQWATTALTIPLVIVSLYGLYYLLMVIGSIALIPASILVPTVIVFLILLNGSVFWLTRRLPKAGKRKQENVHLKRRSFLKLLSKTTFSLAIGGLFIKAYIWDDPSKQWLLTDLFHHETATHKLTLAPPSGILLDDASHLNSSIVAEIRSPKTVAEIIKAIRDAKSTNKKISLSGIRHSMGGQALGLNTLHLDMTHMDSVRYNDSDQTVTVGPGATWRQIQTSLSQHDRAVRVMQDSNIFSVGGSLSVNAHGKDPQYGSLIESVNYLKMVTADGKEILCEKTQNKDLFSAVIGGYGLLGIITEVNLLTTQNSIYAFSLIPTQTNALIDTLESLSKNPENRLLEAHLSVDGERFLTESLIYTYAEAKSSAKPKDELDGENSIWLRKVIFQASRTSNFGKFLRWEMEKHLSPLIEPKTVSRNTAMAVPVRFLQNPDPHTTDILQEYFVPTEQANNFLERYKKLVKKYHINVLNVTIRKVNKDINALISYAQGDMYGFVVYYKINQNSIDTQTLNAFTRELIEYLISIKATYYLCYGSYSSPSQLTTMYPDIHKLFVLKTQHDPDRLFTNVWYEKYRGGISDSPIF
jgi:decaprenylphospho-beta-D-ribofuranose 2-oxidase